jgi:hypothetical protein
MAGISISARGPIVAFLMRNCMLLVLSNKRIPREISIYTNHCRTPLFAFCGKSLLRAQYQSDIHQIFTKCSPPVHAKYDKVLKLTKQ